MIEKILNMRNKKYLATLIIAGLAITLIAQRYTPLSTISNYQGIHPSFEAILYDGKLYTNENPLNASVLRVHPSSFDFDPDGDNTGRPNLRGELRDIQIVRDLATYDVQDTAAHILNMGGESKMPYKVYEWEVETDDLIHVYRMENWLCSFEVNLWADPTAGDFWSWVWNNGEVYNSVYDSTEIWLRLEAAPSWYFEGADEVYFGLGYMELAQFTSFLDHENPLVEVMPESKWAAFSIYNSLNGASEYVGNPVAQASTFEGTLLNPAVFRDEWHTVITVDNFGVFDYNSWDASYNTDSVQLKVLVHVFVVGEWTVQPDEERDMEEHESDERGGWLTDLIDLFNDPSWGAYWMILPFGLVGFVLLWFYGIPKFLRKEGDS